MYSKYLLDIGGQVSTGIVVAEIQAEHDQPPGTGDDDTTSTSRQPSATAAAAWLPPEGPSIVQIRCAYYREVGLTLTVSSSCRSMLFGIVVPLM